MSSPPEQGAPPAFPDGAASAPATPGEPGAPGPAPALSRSLSFVFAATAITTAVVTAISWLAPSRYAATGVGLGFVGATWLLVLRYDEDTIRAFGLSLGGLLEPVPLDARRISRDAAVAIGWAAALAAIAFPPFVIGFRAYWHVHRSFIWHAPLSMLDEVAGQLFVVALPEEAFFRGFLQTALDLRWPARWRVLGADVGPGLIVGAAIFALGHVLTTPNVVRLAVFFPALAFGWLRARTRGIGASVVFHAACNLVSGTLARGYGMTAP